MRSNAMESSWLNQSCGVFEMLFSKFDIEEALEELVDELAMRTINVTIQIVGGAAVALQDSREELTQDIDAFHSPSLGFDEAVESVRRKRDWPLTWFNDAATMFASHYETEKDWDLKIKRDGVIVMVAGVRLLLAMKLLAGRGRRDATDIDRLLDACRVTSVKQAQEIFDTYYPTESIAKMALRQIEERFANRGE